MGKAKPLTTLKIIVSVLFGAVVTYLLYTFVVGFGNGGRATAPTAVVATPPIETAAAAAPEPAPEPPQPPPLPEFVVVSAGREHTAAVGADGSLWTWGANNWGQLGDGTDGGDMWPDSGANRFVPTRIGTDYDWATVTTGGTRTAAIKTDGSLWAWGNNERNHLGDGHGGHNVSQNVPTRIGEDYDWASVALGDNHSAALKTDGTLWMWGIKGGVSNGRSGGSTPIAYGSVPTQLGTDSDWVSVSADGGYTALIKADGTLWAWGGGHVFFFVEDPDGEDYIDFGEPVPTRGTWVDIKQQTPAQVGSEARWVSASISGIRLFAVADDGSLWTWDPAEPNHGNHWETARRIGADYDWAAVSTGGFLSPGDREGFTLAIKTDGSLWALGRKHSTAAGPFVTFFNHAEPTRIGTAADWVFVSAGFDHSAGIRADGSLWVWGGNGSGQLGNGASGMEHFIRRSPVQIGTDANWSFVSAGTTHTAALRADGSLWTWGNLGQQLAFAYGATSFRNRPARVGTDADWAAVYSGAGFSLATKTDGSAWTWGWIGQLGGGESIVHAEPARIESDTGWASVAAAQSHGTGIRADGSLWSWGGNDRGQLGRFSPSDQTHLYHPAARIGEDDDWAAVFSGPWHNLAVRRDGSLWAWGSNEHGQLGIGTISGQFDRRITPLRAGAEYDWAGAVISLCHRRSVAVKADGTLWEWGGSHFFSRSGTRSPTRIGADSDWVSVSAGGTFSMGGHAVAIKRDGSLWAWGNNEVGQLGDGTSINRTVPTRIGESYDWVFASAGNFHTAAVKTDGTLWAWGWNLGGQLGDGTEDDLAPQRVGR